MAAAISSSSSIWRSRSVQVAESQISAKAFMPTIVAVFFQVCVVPQGSGDQNAALTVRLALHSVGIQQRQRPGLGVGQLVHILGHLVPLGLGVNGQAVLGADGDVKPVSQCLPHIGGNHQPALGVNGVIGLAHESGHSGALLPYFLGFRGPMWHRYPHLPHFSPPHTLSISDFKGDCKYFFPTQTLENRPLFAKSQE